MKEIVNNLIFIYYNKLFNKLDNELCIQLNNDIYKEIYDKLRLDITDELINLFNIL